MTLVLLHWYRAMEDFFGRCMGRMRFFAVRFELLVCLAIYLISRVCLVTADINGWHITSCTWTVGLAFLAFLSEFLLFLRCLFLISFSEFLGPPLSQRHLSFDIGTWIRYTRRKTSKILNCICMHISLWQPNLLCLWMPRCPSRIK